MKLPVVFVMNGDAADGDHHNTPQIVSRNIATQLRIAHEVLKPALDVADHTIIMRGTEAHVGKNAWIEEKIAEDIGAVPAAEGRWSHWHLYAEFGGVLFDIKHHPETADRVPWTAGSAANRIAAMMTVEYGRTGDRIPDIALRAHTHGFRDSGENHITRVFTTPPWQLTTAFGHRIGEGGKVMSMGSMSFICRNNEYVYNKKKYTPKRDKPFRIALEETS